jgi:hypothetical protein
VERPQDRRAKVNKRDSFGAKKMFNRKMAPKYRKNGAKLFLMAPNYF